MTTAPASTAALFIKVLPPMQEATLPETQMYDDVTSLTVKRKSPRFGEGRVEVTIEHDEGTETIYLYGPSLDSLEVSDTTIRYHSNNHS